MRTGSSWSHAAACMLVGVLLLAGCGQRIRAEVSAVVEQGYQPQGQSFALVLMPGFTVEDPAASRAAVETDLVPALQAMGYVPVAAGQNPVASSVPGMPSVPSMPGTPNVPNTPDVPSVPGVSDVPDVIVRVWWFSTGPHPVYRTVEWRDRRHWNRWHGYRRQAVVVEDEYARYLVVEAIAPATATALATDMAEHTTFASPQEAARALPAAPARLLWRVRVESRGNLSRAESVLQALAAAAAPFMGKSGVVHVLVQEGAVVASEAVAP